MADSFIKIQIEGVAEDSGDIRLGDFIEELTAVRNALRQTERVVIRSDERAVDFKIVKLTQSSPAEVTIKVVSRDPSFSHAPRNITRRFTTSLRMVRRGHRYAASLDSKTLETFQALNAPTKKHLSRVTVSGEHAQSVSIDQQFDRGLNRILSVDYRERDEILGRLERLNIHNTTQFDIYPPLGSSRIRCTAPKRLYQKILGGVGQWVLVDGWALYQKDSPFPYAMTVEDINPKTKDEDLPTMSGLHGIAPDATDGKSAEDFVRELRDAHW